MVNSQKKNIYFTSDGSVVRKPLKQESLIDNKLGRLRCQLNKYSKQYETNLREKGLEEEKIKSLSFEWVEQTLRYYENNFGDALDSIITYLDYKIEENEQKNSKLKIR